MKNIYAVLSAIILMTSLCAQSPDKISYQAVVRNNNSQLVAEQSINTKISILQTTATGKAVYEETQTSTTNANGLINIQIGGGTVLSGIFANIDWSAGPYFIKTEIDPLGGTNYTIIANSQLLSVPYALHAKTAESISVSSQHHLGELYGGGVVFWLDGTDLHGLICTMIDLSDASIFSNLSDQLTAGTNDWDGLNNSKTIVAQSGHTSSAAQICLNYTNVDYGTGVFSDWYLPSRGEMNNLWNNIQVVQRALENDGNINTKVIQGSKWYWSSTEYTIGDVAAYAFSFIDGNSGPNGKGNAGLVRAVRTF